MSYSRFNPLSPFLSPIHDRNRTSWKCVRKAEHVALTCGQLDTMAHISNVWRVRDFPCRWPRRTRYTGGPCMHMDRKSPPETESQVATAYRYGGPARVQRCKCKAATCKWPQFPRLQFHGKIVSPIPTRPHISRSNQNLGPRGRARGPEEILPLAAEAAKQPAEPRAPLVHTASPVRLVRALHPHPPRAGPERGEAGRDARGAIYTRQPRQLVAALLPFPC